MKITIKPIIILAFLFFSLPLFAQDKQQISIDSFYTNKTDFLIYSVVLQFDSLSQDALNTKIKNWAGLNFVNMKEVLVSETKEQLTFVYISKSFYVNSLITETYEWYIRMQIEIKDNKIRISFFDDGNVLMTGYYIPSRTYKLTRYFKKDGNSIKIWTDGLISLKTSCINKTIDIENSIKSSQSNIKKDDW